jgi:CubicO group peptidase (beta-lactamase class C family)
MRKTFRQWIIVLLLGVMAPIQSSAMDDWIATSAEAAGFSWDIGERLDKAVKNNALENLHSVIVVRHSKLVFERYYEGYAQAPGKPVEKVAFTPDTPHTMQSIAKSIVSLLYGIALAEGKVPAIETALVNAFPEFVDLARDPERRRIKIKHVLSMTMGLKWHAEWNNNWGKMAYGPDKYRYLLSLPVVAEPGTTWNYSGGANAILRHLISKGAGKSLLEYAQEKLFIPLGITEVHWRSDLRMKPRDLARVGQLVLDQGSWRGIQLVPAEWLKSSFRESASVSENVRYGFQWWLGRLQKTHGQWTNNKLGSDKWIAGLGLWKQGLVILPAHQLVIVVNARNYTDPELIPKIVREYILPAMSD